MEKSPEKSFDDGPLSKATGKWVSLNREAETAVPRRLKKGPFSGVGKVASWPEALPGLTFTKTLKNLGGDLEFYLALLRQYVQEKGTIVDLVRQILAAGKLEEAETIVHGLKGVTSNLGLEALGQVCLGLEEAILGKKTEVSYWLKRLESEQAVALHSIDLLFETFGMDKP